MLFVIHVKLEQLTVVATPMQLAVQRKGNNPCSVTSIHFYLLNRNNRMGVCKLLCLSVAYTTLGLILPSSDHRRGHP